MGTVLGFDYIAFWIVVTGALVNVSGATLGTFLVLRRLSLLGDAISHAVLPGLAMAFLLSDSRSPLPMLLGALVAGLLTTFLVQVIRNHTNVGEDAAMGVVFTSLFALGVVIITQAASHVDVDPGCVLYGILETVPLDTHLIGGVEIPRVALNMFVVTLAVIAFVVVFWKELVLSSFDPRLATTLGFNATLMHYLLMGLVATVTVMAFEAVGSILIIAMLIAPAAAASFLTERISRMLLVASGIGVVSALTGRWGAVWLDTSVASMMAVMAGLIFFASALFAPRNGIIAKRRQQVALALRIVQEDILGLLYRRQEGDREPELPAQQVLAAVGGDWLGRIALWRLERQGRLQRLGDRLALTTAGMEQGATLVRSHRMWESYLASDLGTPPDHVHDPADRVEHYLDRELREHLAECLANDTDPHGRRIPKERGAPEEE